MSSMNNVNTIGNGNATNTPNQHLSVQIPLVGKKAKRRSGPRKCGHCRRLGHNKRTCPLKGSLKGSTPKSISKPKSDKKTVPNRVYNDWHVFVSEDKPSWETLIGFKKVPEDTKSPFSGKKWNPKDVSKGDWEELGDSKVVVELPCSTYSLPCFYRKEFIEQWFDNRPLCPNCNKTFLAQGTQPTGTLHVHSSREWITMSIQFENGVQNSRHPSPGKRYTGTRRTAFYPNNPSGRHAVAMITKAFNHGMLFVIGTSVTTGVTNTVIFGGIHLKTSCRGGPTNHGYPDKNWYVRLMSECKSRGID